MDLVPERAEEEEAEDGREHFGARAATPAAGRRSPATSTAQRRRAAQPSTNRPAADSMTTAADGSRCAGTSSIGTHGRRDRRRRLPRGSIGDEPSMQRRASSSGDDARRSAPRAGSHRCRCDADDRSLRRPCSSSTVDCRARNDVGDLAVLADVEAFHLLFLADAQADRRLDRVPEDEARRPACRPPTATMPLSCAMSSVMPPPLNRPLPVAAPVILSTAKRPTQIVPKTPLNRWTGTAPTGSSIFSVSQQLDRADDEDAGEQRR